MLCSHCSRRVRPIVAIDIDGTLGDYHGHIATFAQNYLQRGLDAVGPYDGSMPHREWFQLNGVSVREFRDIKLAYRQGSMKRSMPPYVDMIELCDTVSEFAELWLTTTRPYLRLDNIDPDTRFWLDLYCVKHDYMLYDESKYQELGNRVDRNRVVAIVDDVDEMYDDAADVFGPAVPILYTSRYNRAVRRPNMTPDAGELWVMIHSRLDNYERQFG